MKKFTLVIIALICGCALNHDRNDKLFSDNVIEYSGDSLRNIAVPLGGIGTGDILVGGRGNILALEILNRASHGGDLPYMTFFSLRCQEKGEQAISRILEATLPDNSPGPYGIERQQLAGLPRFENATFSCRYPFIDLRLSDQKIPLSIEGNFYNPLIPLDVDNSSLPIVRFNWKITNTSNKEVTIALAMNLCNPLFNNNDYGRKTHEGNKNRLFKTGNLQGVYMFNGEEPTSPLFGNLVMATTAPRTTIQTAWYEGAWWDDATLFWTDFAEDGQVTERLEEVEWNGSDWYGSNRQTLVGNITTNHVLKPGESVEIPFYVSWYVPNRVLESSQAFGNRDVMDSMTRNYYSTKFNSSEEVLDYYLQNEAYLLDKSEIFVDNLYNSSLPEYALDAVSANTAILKSTLLMRTEEGWVHGFEGMGPTSGCCPGNCTHVWNYAQTMASLFPQLEQKVREVSFLHDTHENGYQCFRTVFPLSDNWFKSVAADGQMGNIIRLYREWKNSGDTEWLKKLWPKVKLALEFTWKGSGDVEGKYSWQENAKIPWDPNKEGMMRGRQHNTYDIDFFGPNMMTGSLYLAALKACSEMAEHLGEINKADEYNALYLKGKEQYESLLWNGSYFIQKVEVVDGIEIPERLKSPPDNEGRIIPKYQFADGCLTDQLLGQYLAFNAGLGYVIEEDMVQKAMKSVFKYNFIPDFSEFHNVQRVFAVNHEGGMVIGTWPNGNRPRIPFVYADEVWTGVEYEAASNMIWCGLVAEGLEVIKKIRERYRGYNRNPWGEIESGMYYARAMASWSVLLALSGFEYDGIQQYMKFDPKIISDDFSTFWSCGNGWGTYKQNLKEAGLFLSFGDLNLKQLEIPLETVNKVVLDNQEIAFKTNGNIINFNQPLEIAQGQVLQIR